MAFAPLKLVSLAALPSPAPPRLSTARATRFSHSPAPSFGGYKPVMTSDRSSNASLSASRRASPRRAISPARLRRCRMTPVPTPLALSTWTCRCRRRPFSPTSASRAAVLPSPPNGSYAQGSNYCRALQLAHAPALLPCQRFRVDHGATSPTLASPYAQQHGHRTLTATNGDPVKQERRRIDKYVILTFLSYCLESPNSACFSFLFICLLCCRAC